MRQCLRSFAFFSVVVFTLVSRSGAVGSGGLSAQLVGARALGFANAFAGLADDTSANYLNPAGLTQLEGSQLSIGLSPTLLKSKFDGQGISESLDESWAILPNAYFTSRFNDRLAFGFGITVPYGIGTKWSDTGQMRYVATESNLSTLLYNPNISFKATDQLSVAAGVDYLQVLDAQLKSQFDQTGGLAPGTDDVTKELTGDGGSWGYNLAVLWKPIAKHSFGASYRSENKVKVKGDLKLSNLDPAVQAGFNFPSANYSVPVDVEIPFAQSLILGYAYKPNERWSFMFDYEWNDWSTLKNLAINVHEGDPTRATFDQSAPIDYSWRDCNSFAIGTEYTFPNKIQLRGGYSYFPTVIPERTWNPSLPEANTHNFSVGAGFPVRTVTIDVAYFVDWYEKRKVNTQNDSDMLSPLSVDGAYHSKIHVISMSATWKFGQK